MDVQERSALVSSIQENLLSVVGASGNPEQLVKLTTDVVKGTKRLMNVEGIPEELTTRTTSVLTDFIKSAHIIAKNPRGVDAKAIQDFSTNRKAVEKIVKIIDEWHVKATRKTSPVMELDRVMDSINKPLEVHRKSPEAPDDSEKERTLTREIQRKRDMLLTKMEPQANPPQFGNVSETLTVAVKGLMRGADDLSKTIDMKIPSKENLLEPMILITDMVCKLLDVVDTLFVTRYPMRSQVYSFCTALIDNVLAYGCRSKSDNATSLRSIATQTPALLNAAKVMVEQCEMRSYSIEEFRDMSIKRGHEIGQLEQESKRPPPPNPPATKQEPPAKAEFEICCIVCTSVAVDQKTQQPLSKGTELTLMILPTTLVKEVKQDLASRTGLPFENIQFNQGKAELSDGAVINPQNPLPFFLFNKFEPSEEEILELRKDQRRKNRVKIYDIDWSLVKGPVAVALYEYDTLGDDSNLAFDEGEVIEIISKGGDGWWDGRISDRSGSFPASFVEEISSKEEGVRLLDMMKQGRQQSSKIDEGSRISSESNLQSQISTPAASTSSSSNWKLKKRISSNPDMTQSSSGGGEKNRLSGMSGVLFKKKKQKNTYTNLTVFDEEAELPLTKTSPEPPKKPLLPKHLKPPKSFGNKTESSSGQNSPTPAAEEETRSSSAPLSATKQINGQSDKGGASQVKKKRPPPPRPPPFASTHPTQAAKLEKIIHSSQDTQHEEEETESVVTGTITTETKKMADSMEDLLNNLKDFDETVDQHSYASISSAGHDVDYEVISPPKEVEKDTEEVVTIKISDYKPDTDDELLDDEEEEEFNKPVDGLLFAEDDQWKPREWIPSPDGSPVMKRAPRLAKPSFSMDIEPSSLSSSSKQIPRSNSISTGSPHSSRKPTGFVNGGSDRALSQPVHKDVPVAPSVMSRPKKSPKHSPQPLNKLPHPEVPPPVPPPRNKRKAPPPPKPAAKGSFASSRSDMDLSGRDVSSQLGERRWTVSQQKEQLRCYKAPPRSRSPVVQRKTRAVIGDDSGLTFNVISEDEEAKDYTGVGKEGVLLKESSDNSLSDWKPRYFQLVDDGLLYYESTEGPSRSNRPLGELPVNRMVKVVPIGEMRGMYKFAILMRYETSIALGCHSKSELHDWLCSLNEVIETARLQEQPPSYVPSIKAAEYCLEYLLNCPMIIDKTIFKLSGDLGVIKDWLHQIEDGQEADLSFLANPSSALCMLKSLFSPDKLNYIVPAGIAKEISQQVKRSGSVRDIQSKLHHIPDDHLHILQMFLKLFTKILNQTEGNKKHKLEVSDLNRMFGSLLFEGLKSNHSLTLLAYLISTHELMF